MMNEYFSPDYSIARDRFRQSAACAGATLEQLRLDSLGPGGEELTIDIARMGSDNPERILMHTAGVHGVESFAGSAVQLQLLEQRPQLSKVDAVILIHAINPYGMAWLRRFNENNVDLNRNFLAPADQYTGAPDVYRKFNRLINPKGPPRSVDPFVAMALVYILRYGFQNLKQAVAGGQYDYPSGLFFGGHQLEQGPTLLLQWFQQTFSTVKQVTAIDVHTGLGKYSDDILMSRNAPGTDPFRRLQQLLGDRVTPYHPTGRYYRVRGGFLRGLELLVPGPEWTLVLQEFGTFNALTKIRALRNENRWHHYGQKDRLAHPAKQQLAQAFCPKDSSWRRGILDLGRKLFETFM